MSRLSPKTLVGVPSERPKAPGQPCLVVIKGSDIGLRIQLSDETVEVGRSDDCTLTIDSELVSRRHAAIRRIGGKYIVADLESTNGTYVNGERMKTRALREGDTIGVGKTVLRYTESNVEVQYHEHLFNMVSTDGLTGVYNKRYFDDALSREVTRSSQSGGPLSLVLFDIDFFKRINDTHGHPAGDTVLRGVAGHLKTMCQGSSTLARVGGEEFAIILPKTPLDDAHRFAERIRTTLQGAELSYEGTPIPITVSLGAAQHIPPTEDASQLYHRADQQLYAAKRGGRNRVES